MLQGGVVPHWPAVRLRGHLHAVLQGAGDGHSAERGGLGGHRPGHRDPVRPGDHAGPQRGAVHGGPAAGPAARSGLAGGKRHLLGHLLDSYSHI